MGKDWGGRKVLVTGGASFVWSHLVEAVLRRGADVRVVDNLSSGRLEYLDHHLHWSRIDFLQGDLLEQSVARASPLSGFARRAHPRCSRTAA